MVLVKIRHSEEDVFVELYILIFFAKGQKAILFRVSETDIHANLFLSPAEKHFLPSDTLDKTPVILK